MYYSYGKILREFQNGLGAEKYLTTHHERDKETGLDYRGARYYDSDVARFLSLDPLAANFPAWSSYNYVLGNPTTYIDPDGKDSRVAVTRNEGGGGTIRISTVAHVYGKDAEAMAAYANKQVSELNTSSSYVDVKGNTWTVEFDLKFLVNQELMGIDPENKGVNYDMAKNVRGVSEGDNFVCADCMPDDGNIENASVGGTTTISPILSGAVHGVFHNIGLGDNRSMPGDIMFNLAGSKVNRIDQSHFENAAKTVLGEIDYYKDFPSIWSTDQMGVINNILRGINIDNNEYTNEK